MSMQSEQINELATALAKAQGVMENAGKNKTNPHFKSKYADLSAVLDAIRVPLSSNGLSHVQTMQIGERCLILRTTLLHASGQFMATEYPIALALKPQEMGAALTYGRRYSLAAIVGIAQDDDDANSVANTEPVKATNGHGRINETELMLLRDLIETKEVNLPALFKYYKIASLADITHDVLPNVIAAVKAKREREQADA